MELCAHRQRRNCSPAAGSKRGTEPPYAADCHTRRDSGNARRSRDMNRDPIVDEIRQARQKILEACGDDLEKLLDRLKAAEAQDRNRVVSMKSIEPQQRSRLSK